MDKANFGFVVGSVCFLFSLVCLSGCLVMISIKKDDFVRGKFREIKAVISFQLLSY